MNNKTDMDIWYTAMELHKTMNAPWYVSNLTLHNDLQIPLS
jgi:hypothetical protein